MKRTVLFLVCILALALSACGAPLPAAAPPQGGGDNILVDPMPSVVTPTTGAPVLEGPLTVGSTPTPVDPAAAASDEQFIQKWVEAVQQRDFSSLRGLMRDRFAIATWNGSLEVIASDDALARLQGAQLAQGSQPAVRWGTDIPALLLGADPLSFWGPVDQTVRAMHVMGLGSDAAQEAVLVIGREPGSGDFYWHGILIPPDGYFHTANPDSQPTDVRYVRAKEDVNLRTGPGQNYAVEGQVFAGMTLQVAGKSADSAWWHVRCEQDASGFCWVSADLALTEPASAP